MPLVGRLLGFLEGSDGPYRHGMDVDRRGLLLFRRDFRGLTGGHLKVWHYYGHARDSAVYRPAVHLTPASLRGAENPFDAGGAEIVAEWRPERAAALFLAGLDWEGVPEDPGVPVVNLVQGVRHADPGDRRRAFLSRRAVRICVSPEVAEAILATGLVNGPVVTIPNGVDVAPKDGPETERRVPLLVAGWKRPERTREVARAFADRGVAIEVLDQRLPREDFLRRIAEAAIVVFLPLAREGCFLPALEAFASGCVVVCPDCVGNRAFCRDGETCFVPPADTLGIVDAALAAARLAPLDRARMTAAARLEVAARGLEAERAAFLGVLERVAREGAT